MSFMSEFEYQNGTPAGGSYQYNYTNPNGNKPPKEKKKFGLGAVIAVAVISALLCGTVSSAGVYGLMQRANASSASSSDTVSQPSSTAAAVNQTTINVTESTDSVAEAVAKKCTGSVVGIRVTSTKTNTGFWGQQTQSQSASEGSGVIYTADGYIITNYHVISSAVENAQYGSIADGTTLQVYLASDPETGVDATVVGYDASADIALLKIDRTGLPAVEIGDSDKLTVGQKTIAIGSPGGLEYMGSVSQGIVSGLNRSITTESGVQMNLIQTDAAINPGNSGGALLDSTGKLIGINNAKMSGTDYDGIGFAIPVNEVVDICDRLIHQEGTQQAYLGVTINTYYTAEQLQMWGYPSGVVVYSVADNSPAAEAGIQAGDIICKINDTAITSYASMISEKNKYNSGDTIKLTIFRNRQSQEVSVTLQ